MTFHLPPRLDPQSRATNMRASSRRAWENIKPHLSEKRGLAYLCLLDYAEQYGGTMTATEIGHLEPAIGKCPWKRVGELAALGVVAEHAERACTVTNQTVVTYAVVPDALPTGTPTVANAPKRPTPAQMREAVKAMRVFALQLQSNQVPVPEGLIVTAQWLKHLAK